MTAPASPETRSAVGGISLVRVPASDSGWEEWSEGLPAVPLLRSLLARFGAPLADLARRARRLGPIESGAVVLLAGDRPGTGCTTVALALAAAAARERTTALVDGDLARAGLSKMLRHTGGTGWDETVSDPNGTGGAGESLVAGRPFTFFRLAKIPSDAGAHMALPGMAGWIDDLRGGYDLVVVDGGVAERSARWWAPWADVSLLVRDAGRGVRAGPSSGDMLTCGGVPILGAVETFAGS